MIQEPLINRWKEDIHVAGEFAPDFWDFEAGDYLVKYPDGPFVRIRDDSFKELYSEERPDD